MAFQPLSVGDILMLSQQAWKIGRAFKKGQYSAPEEFAEVEREANGLSDALKLTAEALHADGSILSRAEPETLSAVNAILESAARTLGDLESFVEQYSVIKKRETKGGFVVEKTWSEVIIANWKTFKWTTEGGSITELRNILQMHTNTINLTMQALQSRSLARLEKTVIPMAENIQHIHDRVNGDLGHKIDDLHHIIMSIANSTPSLVARDRSLEDGTRDRRRISGSTVSTLDMIETAGSSRMLEPPPPRASSFQHAHQPNASPQDSAQSTPVTISLRPKKHDSHQASMDWEFETGSPPKMRGGSIGGTFDDSPNVTGRSYLSPSTPNSSRRNSSLPRRESTTLPGFFHPIDEDDAVAGSSYQKSFRSQGQRSHDANISPISEAQSNALESRSVQTMLPPPALPPSPQHHQSPATPSSIFTLSQSESQLSSNQTPSHPPTTKSVKERAPLSPALSTLPSFEKALFRNAAILCDVRGKKVEYAKHLPDEPDPRYNVEMVEAVGASRICVIRKREHTEHGGTRVVTAVWALSEDGEVRCQQRLSELADTVPYGSYFQPEKVSIAEGEMVLRLHGDQWVDAVKEEIKSNWINYIFTTENDAIAFQSAIFGRLLLGSYQTLKTTVIHDGFTGHFAFEEQFANIEMLRLWEDDGVATPGAQGGVMALMHISSNFGQGWARWWMNSSAQPVRVKADSSKWARLKGLDITVVKPGTSASAAEKLRRSSTNDAGLLRSNTKDSSETKSPAKKSPVKTVKGVRIEFKDESERNIFVETNRRIQAQLFPLPDL